MKTRITELLGIEYPVVQGAMAMVAFWPLVAAVSEAGGLGIIATITILDPEELRVNVRKVKERTNKPFGVNIIPDNPALDRFLDIIVEEKVPVVSYGAGNPQRIIERTRPLGIIAMPTVGSLQHALKAERDGAHAIIVQGTEAGGHNSHVSSSVLVPLVAESVQIPIVAAGGFCDARMLVAALAMGAEGICMGTRFMCTQECPVPDSVKQKVLDSSEEDTVVTKWVTGVPMRIVRNKLAEEHMKKGEQNTPARNIMGMAIPQFRKVFQEGDAEWGSLACGQVAGRIHDLPTCRELMERIVGGAEDIARGIWQKTRVPAAVNHRR